MSLWYQSVYIIMQPIDVNHPQLNLLPSVISIVTGLLILLMFQFPSHLRLIVDIDNQTARDSCMHDACMVVFVFHSQFSVLQAASTKFAFHYSLYSSENLAQRSFS